MADPGVDRTDARDQLSISMGPLLAHVCEHPMPGPKLWGILPHGCIVLQLAQRHSGTGWLENDRIFRRHAASDPSIPWNVLNPSLMAATVLTTSPAGLGNSICPHCQAADHRRPVISGHGPPAHDPSPFSHGSDLPSKVLLHPIREPRSQRALSDVQPRSMP